jgi:hypothetical protein
MPRITLEQLIAGYPQIVPEQISLLKWFYESFDYRGAGANVHIANVEYLFSQRATGGSEFETYAATKLYIAFKVMFSWVSAASASAFQIALYNSANAINGYVNPQTATYTGAALNYAPHSVELHNLYFSRVAALAGTSYILFNGLRVTLD